MSLIILNVDEVRRTLSASGGAFVTHDKEVDIVRFAINSGFADIVLDGQVALRVMYQRPGETEVRAQTLTYYDTDGLRNYYDWQLLPADLTKKGTLTVALCILDISGGEVSEWHTTPCQVRVLDTIHTDDSDEADETITPTVAQRVAVLETMIQRVASGAPIVVASTSAMTDTDQIYVLSTNGRWYYHNGSAWVSGGEYGAVSTDTTLTKSGMAADAKKTGDEITGLKSDLNNSASTYNAERHWFVAGRYLKGNDTFATGNRYAYSLSGIFNLTAGLIKITSLNGVFDFSVVDRDAHTLTAWSDEITIASGNYTVNLRKKDGTDIIGTDINDVEVRVLGFDFYGHTHIKLDETKKLLHYSNLLSGRQLINSGDKEGVGDYTTSKYNATKFALYSDKNIDIWVGRSDTCIVDVFINGLCVASVSQGEHYTIEANTNFVLGWHNAVPAVPNGSNIFLIVDGAEATLPTGVAQYFANPTTFSRTPDVGCSFLVNDKIFSISDSGTYCVTKGETVLIQNATLDVSAGHANSCNFSNGKVYVSDWDDPATIHVYDVDSENNALTHSKDIMLGVDAETGSTEYFVFDDEKQIISLGWKTGDSGTNPNVLTYALWLSTTGGYVKAWERYALRPRVLQAMTVQNGYIYYINCYGSNNSYKFIGVNRINIETGVTEYTSIEPAGSILDLEGEGIIPIGNEVFLIVMNNGRVYLFAFV